MRTQIDLIGMAAHARRFNLLGVTVPEMLLLIKALDNLPDRAQHDILEFRNQLYFAVSMADYNIPPPPTRDPLTGRSS